MFALHLFLVAVFLALNAFFVLAEFAAVKVRATRVEELAETGNRRARLLQLVLPKLDEYLSVCQVGITFASIGLGFVGEPAVAGLLLPLFARLGSWSETVAHSIAVIVAYLGVSFLHILLGELVPKSIAIRRAEDAALWTAPLLRVARILFYLPLVLLNGSANAILRLIGLRYAEESEHTEEELRILLGRSQETGLLSFRQLLFIENVFDFGGLRARDVMRPREEVRVLRTGASWAENWRTIRESRFSRFPLLDADPDRPIGVIHVKDLLYRGTEAIDAAVLRSIVRPHLTAQPDDAVEGLLTQLQRRRPQVVLVHDAKGVWGGFLTFEDVIEEIVGSIEDEFEREPRAFLSDSMSVDRIVLDVEAPSVRDAIRRAIERLEPGTLPIPAPRVLSLLLAREEALSTYVGRGLCLPHARIEGLERPVVVFVRCRGGVPVDRGGERADLLFVLLTPIGLPRVHSRLLSRIAQLFDSEYVVERLRSAGKPEEILETIRAGEPVVSVE